MMERGNGMTLDIEVYKPSGKCYANETVRFERDIDYFLDDFTVAVVEALPSRYPGGYVVVTDNPGTGFTQTFHRCLYKMDELLADYGKIVAARSTPKHEYIE